MFVPSFLAFWWPKIDRKSGFPQLFAKTVGSIHFIPGIYAYGVSLWTPIDFRVRALIFGPLVAKNWPKIGVSATFLNDSHQCSYHNDLKIGLFVGYFLMGWVLIRAGVYCPHLWAQLVEIEATSWLLMPLYRRVVSNRNYGLSILFLWCSHNFKTSHWLGIKFIEAEWRICVTHVCQ